MKIRVRKGIEKAALKMRNEEEMDMLMEILAVYQEHLCFSLCLN